ncbi:pseudaminic acid biosynthesis-associated protein PseG [Thalassoporum mexicanum PCC 7367]|uniref:UDP-2,4-diacetamido-2,4, 6-trideoxy-beta-L-altropyranose hydrolase n=1 Tax=Thalassoporum mexicanum TaxID=3457544 RepID=UPI00029FB504|nr:UDP-2,4-diacetamido-2,4,6-trideoxy-beta-L-altropyranose hydrolase [Pseudanabaena sp. PCC 7367]AFY69682.1 pseudaminic acid biosynthesis-associated protein PseG [Pseudanabaena sp. PCC 7367]
MRFLVRVDASQTIGTGHLMRTLALVQALQPIADLIVFVVVELLPALEQRLLDQNFQVKHLRATIGDLEDSKQTIDLAQQLQIDWLILDGYDFKPTYQRAIKSAAIRFLYFDDYGHLSYYWADLVLNQNVSAEPAWYSDRHPDTKLLLGSNYALLRQEFATWQYWQRSLDLNISQLLITLGGSDPDNVTLKVVQALAMVRQTQSLAASVASVLKVTVVIGAGYRYAEQLKHAIAQLTSAPSHKNLKIELIQNATQMAHLIANADLAIAAAGSTCWELAFMGLPAILIVTAENQRLIAAKLAELGVSINLGWHQQITPAQIAMAIDRLWRDPQQRLVMSKNGQRLIDGQGKSRILAKLKQIPGFSAANG